MHTDALGIDEVELLQQCDRALVGEVDEEPVVVPWRVEVVVGQLIWLGVGIPAIIFTLILLLIKIHFGICPLWTIIVASVIIIILIIIRVCVIIVALGLSSMETYYELGKWTRIIIG